MKSKRDARSLPAQVIEEKRRESHRLRKRGLTRAEIGEIVGVHADTVGRWLKMPVEGLMLKRRGSRPGGVALYRLSRSK